MVSHVCIGSFQLCRQGNAPMLTARHSYRIAAAFVVLTSCLSAQHVVDIRSSCMCPEATSRALGMPSFVSFPHLNVIVPVPLLSGYSFSSLPCSSSFPSHRPSSIPQEDLFLVALVRHFFTILPCLGFYAFFPSWSRITRNIATTRYRVL